MGSTHGDSPRNMAFTMASTNEEQTVVAIEVNEYKHLLSEFKNTQSTVHRLLRESAFCKKAMESNCKETETHRENMHIIIHAFNHLAVATGKEHSSLLHKPNGRVSLERISSVQVEGGKGRMIPARGGPTRGAVGRGAYPRGGVDEAGPRVAAAVHN